jgi:hypothetical protein
MLNGSTILNADNLDRLPFGAAPFSRLHESPAKTSHGPRLICDQVFDGDLGLRRPVGGVDNQAETVRTTEGGSMTTLMVHVILGDVLIAAPRITACDGLDHARQDLNSVRLGHFLNGDCGDTGLAPIPLL